MKRVAILISLFLLSCGMGSVSVKNPIRRSSADPWVTLWEGKYYYCCSSGKSIGVSVSDRPYVINEPKTVWAPEPDAWNRACIWAPELHRWNGKWYIFYAAGESGPPFIYQRTGVLESESDDPTGKYVEKALLNTGDGDENIWAIDFTFFEHGDRLYGVWSGWAQNEPSDATEQNLYIAEMSNPWTISSKRVMISAPDTDYERRGGYLPINEGPEVLKHEDNLFVIYSCGQSWLPTYKLSWLKLKSANLDPLLPENWQKSDRAVFEGTDRVHGAGHASFTTSKDGKRHYMLFHTKQNTTPGWGRDIHIQRFDFNDRGEPEFGIPIPAGEEVKL